MKIYWYEARKRVANRHKWFWWLCTIPNECDVGYMIAICARLPNYIQWSSFTKVIGRNRYTSSGCFRMIRVWMGGGGGASTFCHKLPNKIELKASNAPFGLFAYPAIQQSSTELSNLFHWKITVPANWFFEYKINQIDTIEFLFTASGSIRASFLYSKIAFV